MKHPASSDDINGYLATTEFALIAIDGEILLHFNEKAGIPKTHLLATTKEKIGENVDKLTTCKSGSSNSGLIF